METLKCIHNALTVGIFVLFLLICILVNKCCVVYDGDENRRKYCTCRHVEITGEITPSNNIIVKTPGKPTVKTPLYEYLQNHAGKPSPSCDGCCSEGNICESCTNLQLAVIHAPHDGSERSTLLKLKSKRPLDKSEEPTEEPLGSKEQIKEDATQAPRTVRPSYDPADDVEDLHVEGSHYELKTKQSRAGLASPTVLTKVKVPLDESFSRTTTLDGKSSKRKRETTHDDKSTATSRESRSETSFSISIASRRSKSPVDSIRSRVGKTSKDFSQNIDDDLLTSRPATAQSSFRGHTASQPPSIYGSNKTSSSRQSDRPKEKYDASNVARKRTSFENERPASARRSSLQPETSQDEDEYAKPKVTTTRIDDNKFLTKVRRSIPSSKKASDGTHPEDAKDIKSGIIDPTIIDRRNVLKTPSSTSFFEKDATRNLYNQMHNKETEKSAVLSEPGYKTYDSSPYRRKPNETTFVYDKDKGKYIAVPSPDNPESCAMYCDKMVLPICRPSEDQGKFLPDIQPEVSSRKRPLSLDKNTPRQKASPAYIPNKKVKRASTDHASLENQLKIQGKPKIIPCRQNCSFTPQNREIINYEEVELQSQQEGKKRYEEDISNPHKVSSHPNRKNTVRDSHHLVGNKISHFSHVADPSKRGGKKKVDRSHDSAYEDSRTQRSDQRNTYDENIPSQAIDEKSRSGSSKRIKNKSSPSLLDDPSADSVTSAASVSSEETFTTPKSTKPGDDINKTSSTESTLKKSDKKVPQSKSGKFDKNKKYMEKSISVTGKGKKHGSVEYKKNKKVNMNQKNSKNKDIKHSTTFKETVKAPTNVEVLSLTTTQPRDEEFTRLYEQYAPKLAQCCRDYVKKHLSIDERDASTDKPNVNVDDFKKKEKVMSKDKEKQSKKRDDTNLSDYEFDEDDGEHDKKHQNKSYDEDTKSMTKKDGKRSKKQDYLSPSDYEFDEDDGEHDKKRQSRSYDADTKSMTKKEGKRSKKQDDLSPSDYEFDEDDGEHDKKSQSRSYDEDTKSMMKQKGKRSKKQDDLSLADYEFDEDDGEHDKRRKKRYDGENTKTMTKKKGKRSKKQDDLSLSDHEIDEDDAEHDKKRKIRSYDEDTKSTSKKKGKRSPKQDDSNFSDHEFDEEDKEYNKRFQITYVGDDGKLVTFSARPDLSDKKIEIKKTGRRPEREKETSLSDDESDANDKEDDKRRQSRYEEDTKSKTKEMKKSSKKRDDLSNDESGENDKIVKIIILDGDDTKSTRSKKQDDLDFSDDKSSEYDGEYGKKRQIRNEDEDTKSIAQDKRKRSKKRDDLHLSEDDSDIDEGEHDKSLQIRYDDGDEISVRFSTPPDHSDSKIEIKKTERWTEREKKSSFSDDESDEDDKKYDKSRHKDEDTKSMAQEKGKRSKKRDDLHLSDDESEKYEAEHDKSVKIIYDDVDEISIRFSTPPDHSDSKIEIKKTERWPEKEKKPSLSDDESDKDDKSRYYEEEQKSMAKEKGTRSGVKSGDYDKEYDKKRQSRYEGEDTKSMAQEKRKRSKKRDNLHGSDDESDKYEGEHDKILQIRYDDPNEISVRISTQLGHSDSKIEIKNIERWPAREEKPNLSHDDSDEYDKSRYKDEDTKTMAQEKGNRSKKRDDLHGSDDASDKYEGEHDKILQIRYVDPNEISVRIATASDHSDSKIEIQNTERWPAIEERPSLSRDESDEYDKKHDESRYKDEDTKSMAQEKRKRSKKRDDLHGFDDESDKYEGEHDKILQIRYVDPNEISVRIATPSAHSDSKIETKNTERWPAIEEKPSLSHDESDEYDKKHDKSRYKDEDTKSMAQKKGKRGKKRDYLHSSDDASDKYEGEHDKILQIIYVDPNEISIRIATPSDHSDSKIEIKKSERWYAIEERPSLSHDDSDEYDKKHDKSRYKDEDTKSMGQEKQKKSKKRDDLHGSDDESDKYEGEHDKILQIRYVDPNEISVRIATPSDHSDSKIEIQNTERWHAIEERPSLSDDKCDECDKKHDKSRYKDEDTKSMAQEKRKRSKKRDDLHGSDDESDKYEGEHDKILQIRYVDPNEISVRIATASDHSDSKIEIQNTERWPAIEERPSLSHDESDEYDKKHDKSRYKDEDSKSMAQKKGKRGKKRDDLHGSDDESDKYEGEHDKILQIRYIDPNEISVRVATPSHHSDSKIEIKKSAKLLERKPSLSDEESDEYNKKHDKSRYKDEDTKSMVQEKGKRSKKRDDLHISDDESDKYEDGHDKSLQIIYDDPNEISVRFSTPSDHSDSKMKIKKSGKLAERKPSLSDEESDEDDKKHGKSRYTDEDTKSMGQEKEKRSKKRDDLHVSDDESDKYEDGQDKSFQIIYNDPNEISVIFSAPSDHFDSKIEIKQSGKLPKRKTKPSLSDEESDEDDKEHDKSRYYDEEKKSMAKEKGTRSKKRDDLDRSNDESGENNKILKIIILDGDDTISMTNKKSDKYEGEHHNRLQIRYDDTNDISLIFSRPPHYSDSTIEIKKTDRWPDDESDEDEEDKKSKTKENETRDKKRNVLQLDDEEFGEYSGEYDKVLKIVILDGDDKKSMKTGEGKRSRKRDDLDLSDEKSGEYNGEYVKKPQIKYESEDTISIAQEKRNQSKRDDLHLSDNEFDEHDGEHYKKRKRKNGKRSKKRDDLDLPDDESDKYDGQHYKKISYDQANEKVVSFSEIPEPSGINIIRRKTGRWPENEEETRYLQRVIKAIVEAIKKYRKMRNSQSVIVSKPVITKTDTDLVTHDSFEQNIIEKHPIKEVTGESQPSQPSSSRYRQDNQPYDISYVPTHEEYDKERRPTRIPFYQTKDDNIEPFSSRFKKDVQPHFKPHAPADKELGKEKKTNLPNRIKVADKKNREIQDMESAKIKKPVVKDPESDDKFEKLPTEEERRTKKPNLPQDKTVTGDSLLAVNKEGKKETHEAVKVLYSYDKRTSKQEEIYIQFSDDFALDDIAETSRKSDQSSDKKETKNAKIIMSVEYILDKDKTKTGDKKDKDQKIEKYQNVEKKLGPKQPRTRKDILLGKKSISSEPSIVSSELVIILNEVDEEREHNVRKRPRMRNNLSADILLDKKSKSSSVIVVYGGNIHPYDFDQERRETISQTKINLAKKQKAYPAIVVSEEDIQPSSTKKKTRGKKAKVILSVEDIPGEDEQEVTKKSKTEFVKKQQKNVGKQPRTRKDVLPDKKSMSPELSFTFSETVIFNEDLGKDQEQKVRKAPRTRKDLPANKNVTRSTKEKEPIQPYVSEGERGEIRQQTKILIDSKNKPYSVIVESKDEIQPHGSSYVSTDGELNQERRESRRKTSSTNELLHRFLSVLGIPIPSISRFRGHIPPYALASREVDEERSESTSTQDKINKFRPVLDISISSTGAIRDNIKVFEKEPVIINVAAGTDTETDELLEQQILEKVRMTKSFKEYMARQNIVTAEIGTDTSMDELVKQYILEKMKDNKEKEPKVVTGTSATDTEVDYLLEKYIRKKRRLKNLKDKAKGQPGKESYKSIKISVIKQKSDPERPCRKEEETTDYILTLPHNTPIESLSLDDIEYIFSRSLDEESDEPSEKYRTFSFIDDIPSSSEDMIYGPDNETLDQERRQTSSSIYGIVYKFLSVFGIPIPSISHLRGRISPTEMPNVPSDKDQKKRKIRKQVRIPCDKFKKSGSDISISEPCTSRYRQDISTDGEFDQERSETRILRDKVIHYRSDISISKPSTCRSKQNMQYIYADKERMITKRQTRIPLNKINKSCSSICISEPSTSRYRQDKQNISADEEFNQKGRETKSPLDKLKNIFSKIGISKSSTSISKQDMENISADKERKETKTQTRNPLAKLKNFFSGISKSVSSISKSKQDMQNISADKEFDKEKSETSTQTRISCDKILHYRSVISISESSTSRSRQDMQNISVDKEFYKERKVTKIQTSIPRDKLNKSCSVICKSKSSTSGSKRDMQNISVDKDWIETSTQTRISKPSTYRSRQDMQTISVDKEFNKERKVTKIQTSIPRDKLNKSCSVICKSESSTSRSTEDMKYISDDKDRREISTQTIISRNKLIHYSSEISISKPSTYRCSVICKSESSTCRSKQDMENISAVKEKRETSTQTRISKPSTYRSRQDMQNISTDKEFDKERKVTKRQCRISHEKLRKSISVIGISESSTSRYIFADKKYNQERREISTQTRDPHDKLRKSVSVIGISESSTLSSRLVLYIPTDDEYDQEEIEIIRPTRSSDDKLKTSISVISISELSTSSSRQILYIPTDDECDQEEIKEFSRQTTIPLVEKYSSYLFEGRSESFISRYRRSFKPCNMPVVYVNEEFDKERRESRHFSCLCLVSRRSEPSTSRSRNEIQPYGMTNVPNYKEFDKEKRKCKRKTKIPLHEKDSSYAVPGKTEPSTSRSKKDIQPYAMPNVPSYKEFHKKKRKCKCKIKTPLQEKDSSSSTAGKTEPSSSRSRKDIQPYDMPNMPNYKEFDKKNKKTNRETKTPIQEKSSSYSVASKSGPSTAQSRKDIQPNVAVDKEFNKERKTKRETKTPLQEKNISCRAPCNTKPSTSRSKKDIQPYGKSNVPISKEYNKENIKTKRENKTPLREKNKPYTVAGKTEPSTSRSKKDIQSYDKPNVPNYEELAKEKRKTKRETKTPLQEKNKFCAAADKTKPSTAQSRKDIQPNVAINKEFNKEERKTKRETKTPLQDKNKSCPATCKTEPSTSRSKKDIQPYGMSNVPINKEYNKENIKTKRENKTPLQEKLKPYAVAGKTEPSTSRSKKDIQPYGMSNVPINKEYNKENIKTKRENKTPLQEKLKPYAVAGKTEPSTSRSKKDIQPHDKPNVPNNKELAKENIKTKKENKTPLQEKHKPYAVAGKTEPSTSRSKKDIQPHDKPNVPNNKELAKEKTKTKTPLDEKNRSYREADKSKPSTSPSPSRKNIHPDDTPISADEVFDKDRKDTTRKTRFNPDKNRYYSFVDEPKSYIPSVPTDENIDKERKEGRSKTKIPLDERNKSCKFRGKSVPVTSRSRKNIKTHCTPYVPVDKERKKVEIPVNIENKCNSVFSKSEPVTSRSKKNIHPHFMPNVYKNKDRNKTKTLCGKKNQYHSDDESESLEFVEVFQPYIMQNSSEEFYKERGKSGISHDKIVKIFPKSDESKPSTSQSSEHIQRHCKPHIPVAKNHEDSKKKPVLKTLYPQDDGPVSTTSRSKEGLYPYYSSSIAEYHSYTSSDEELEKVSFKDRKLKKCFCRKKGAKKGRKPVDVENLSEFSKSEPITCRCRKNMQPYNTPFLSSDKYDKRIRILYKKHSFYSGSSESISHISKENIQPYDVPLVSVDEESRQHRRTNYVEEETFEFHKVASSNENLTKAPFMRKLMEEICPEVEVSATSIQGQITTVKKGKQGFVIGKDGRIIKCTCRKKGAKKGRCICKKKHGPSTDETIIKITEKVATKDEIKVDPLSYSNKTCFEKLPSYQKVSFADNNFGNFKPCKCNKTTRNYNIHSRSSSRDSIRAHKISSKITGTPGQEQTSVIRIRVCDSNNAVKTYKVTSKITITARQQASIQQLTDSIHNIPLLRIRIFKDDSHQPCPTCSISKPTSPDKMPCVYLDRLRKDKAPTTFYNTWSSNIPSATFDSHPTTYLTGKELISSRVAAILAKYHKPLEDSTGKVCPGALQGRKMIKYFSDGPSTSDSPPSNPCPPKKHYCIPVPPDYNSVMRVYSPIVIPKNDPSLKSIYVRGKKKKSVCKCKNLHPKRPTVSNDIPSTSRAPDP